MSPPKCNSIFELFWAGDELSEVVA